jgi:HAD-hyrolase-like
MFDLDGTLLLSDRSLDGMAQRGGARSFAVTTGVTAREEWELQTGLRRPEHVLRRLGDLLESVPPLSSENQRVPRRAQT